MVRKTFTYTQVNTANINKVFPLLCPVREKEWLDGWEYEMVHSVSGLIEKDCVFTTPNPNGANAVWYVTRYSREMFAIEFLKVTPGECVARITIELEPVGEHQTLSHISYSYTALNEEQKRMLDLVMGQRFMKAMEWWEKAINHYLSEGKILKRSGEGAR